MPLREAKDPTSAFQQKISTLASQNLKDNLPSHGYSAFITDSCNKHDEKVQNERAFERHGTRIRHKKVSHCFTTQFDERKPAKKTNTVSASSSNLKKRKTREPATHSDDNMANYYSTLQQQQTLIALLPTSQKRSKRELRVTVKHQGTSIIVDTNLQIEETGRDKRKKTCVDDRASGSVPFNSPKPAPTLPSLEINRRILPPRLNRGTSSINMKKITGATYVVPEGGGGKGSTNDVIAEDGNHFLCHMCLSTGDVICCDGCPKVYHVHCLPEGKSKDTIDKDPWFCPDCLVDPISKKKHNHTIKRSLPTRGLKRKNSEVRQPFIDEKYSVVAKSRRRATTWASMASFPGKLGSKPTLSPSARIWNAKQRKTGNLYSREKVTDVENDGSGEKSNAAEKKKKNLRMEKRQCCRSGERKNDYSTKKFKTEHQKNERKHSDASKNRPVEAKPAFFFFLKENLKSLEKKASQKDHSFKAYPHGFARNRILATIGAKKWSKLSPEQQLHYEKRSMEDFEECLRHRRNRSPDKCNGNDKNLPEIFLCGAAIRQLQPSSTNLSEDENSNSSRPNLKRFKDFLSLAVSDTVEIPSRRDDGGANLVLLDLLQDIRFHPIPMLAAKDHQRRFLSIERKSDISDTHTTNTQQKQALTRFESQGPISTFTGDVCLGCSRGWCHFCPVLKKQFPAVEYRSLLQPPLSSLSGTRIGLIENKSKFNKNHFQQVTSGNSSEKSEHRNVLDYPEERNDDIVKFVSCYTDVKVPKSLQINSNTEAIYPTANLNRVKMKREEIISLNQSDSAMNSSDAMNATMSMPNVTKSKLTPVVYRCNCGNVAEFKEGCVTCRRSLLLKIMSNNDQVSESNFSIEEQGQTLLKMHTVMMPRMIRRSNFDRVKDGEKAVATVLSLGTWKPNAVMPYKGRFTGTKENPSFFSSTSLFQREEFLPPAPMRPSLLNSTNKKAADRIIGTRMNKPIRSLRSRNKHENAHIKSDEKSSHRQSILQKHKDEENMVQKKCLSIALCGIFLGLVRRDPQRIFAEPVPQSEIEYHRIIPHPMDFHTVREKILANQYSFGTFLADVRLLCTNALAFNDPQSIYAITAQRILDDLECMQERASHWMTAIKNTLVKSFHSAEVSDNDDPFARLRKSWPGAVELLDDVEWYRKNVYADFVRTKENETAYFGSLAIQRASTAAACSTYVTGLHDLFKPCIIRSSKEDERLRRIIDKKVALLSDPIRRLDQPTWREMALLTLLRKIQSIRVESIASMTGCARCDGIGIGEKAKLVVAVEAKTKSSKQRGQEKARIDESRSAYSTGLASSAVTAKCIRKDILEPDSPAEAFSSAARNHLVSVQGSSIHGWGLFAEQPMVAGEVVAEYIGEYVSNAVADSREKKYHELRIQDYQFRVGSNLVIDATLKGGYARYINHSCDPNCVAKIMNGDYPLQCMKRVMVIAKRDIKSLEEITYDYKFPLINDLDARIPCSCGTKSCRGFMNWDRPEKKNIEVVDVKCGEEKPRGLGRVCKNVKVR